MSLQDNRVLELSKVFAVRIIRLAQHLDAMRMYSLANQILKAGTSIGANIHESQCAESRRDFIHKLHIAFKEARETEYWLEILTNSELVTPDKLQNLNSELNEILSLLTTIIKTTKSKQKNERN
jgi:four helix bundle protein